MQGLTEDTSCRNQQRFCQDQRLQPVYPLIYVVLIIRKYKLIVLLQCAYKIRLGTDYTSTLLLRRLRVVIVRKLSGIDTHVNKKLISMHKLIYSEYDSSAACMLSFMQYHVHRQRI